MQLTRVIPHYTSAYRFGGPFQAELLMRDRGWSAVAPQLLGYLKEKRA